VHPPPTLPVVEPATLGAFCWMYAWHMVRTLLAL
jgi:hypothetical protein